MLLLSKILMSDCTDLGHCVFFRVPIWGTGKDQHCRLHRMGNDFYVMALESQIGTLVDGQLLGQRALAYISNMHPLMVILQ